MRGMMTAAVRPATTTVKYICTNMWSSPMKPAMSRLNAIDATEKFVAMTEASRCE
jgi:hypothetical protein